MFHRWCLLVINFWGAELKLLLEFYIKKSLFFSAPEIKDAFLKTFTKFTEKHQQILQHFKNSCSVEHLWTAISESSVFRSKKCCSWELFSNFSKFRKFYIISYNAFPGKMYFCKISFLRCSKKYRPKKIFLFAAKRLQ